MVALFDLGQKVTWNINMGDSWMPSIEHYRKTMGDIVIVVKIEDVPIATQSGTNHPQWVTVRTLGKPGSSCDRETRFSGWWLMPLAGFTLDEIA